MVQIKMTNPEVEMHRSWGFCCGKGLDGADVEFVFEVGRDDRCLCLGRWGGRCWVEGV